jgi:hypothetical protein
MIAVTVALITFVCVAGGALVGLLLGAVLPPRHLESDSKDTVKLGMGLVATMTAILLGLLIASVSPPLLGALVCWLVLIFFSFGLLAPRTPIVAVTLCLCALAVSSAIFLVIDMYSPFSGVVRVSSVSLQTALDRLGK